uniref:Ionotropic glutamate receptor C-terminal domain-containing protein n=1 Tax=Trichogramma kaykai TaxID=54128 RepID=A0ABD2XGE1_9HYME
MFRTYCVRLDMYRSDPRKLRYINNFAHPIHGWKRGALAKARRRVPIDLQQRRQTKTTVRTIITISPDAVSHASLRFFWLCAIYICAIDANHINETMALPEELDEYSTIDFKCKDFIPELKSLSTNICKTEHQTYPFISSRNFIKQKLTSEQPSSIQQVSLTIALIDPEVLAATGKDLFDMIYHLCSTIADPCSARPPCLVLSCAPIAKDIVRTALELMWSKKYLHVTLVDLSELALVKSSFYVVYHYVPFTDTLVSSNRLESSRKLFPIEPNNFHGYPLRSQCYENLPFVMLGPAGDGDESSISDRLYGTDVYLARSLARTLNFSLVIANYSSRFNETLKHVFADDLVRGELDFYINLYVIKGRLEANVSMCQALFFFGGDHLTIKQKAHYELEVSWNVAVACLAFVAAISIVVQFARLAGYRRSIWTIYNVATQSSSSSPRDASTGEKLLWLSAVVLSSCFNLTLLDQLFNVVTSKPKFYDLARLADVLESGLKLIVDEGIEQKLLGYRDQLDDTLERILARARVVKLTKRHQACFLALHDDTVNACVFRYYFANWLKLGFARLGRTDLALSYVEEPLQPVRTAMILGKNSPFLAAFDLATLRIVEAGLIQHYYDKATRTWLELLPVARRRDFSSYSEVAAQKNRVLDKVQSKLSIFRILSIAYFMSGCLLIIEILWTYCMKEIMFDLIQGPRVDSLEQ